MLQRPLFQHYRFCFPRGLSALTFVCLVVLLGLGHWQLERRAWKEALIAQVETRRGSDPLALFAVWARHNAGIDQTYQPVFIRGRYDHTREAHLSGIHDGAPGWFVFTPFEIEHGPDEAGPSSGGSPGFSFSPYIFINRGFVPDDRKDRRARPESDNADRITTVTGLFRAATPRPPIAAFFKPPDNPNKNEWYDRTPDLWAAHAGIRAEGFTIDSFDSTAVNAPLGGITRLEFRNRHQEYALTWFGLAGALVIVYLTFCLRRLEEPA